eukprot:TRINITY_DN6027_c0_g1_i1.p1 TRINITY_DN6027_c0_g1~~TRINITY_DN6027_c0_g1_i1.p1  ORF type:complete len:164 (-),score=7.78 TRINITY_DN6027_c0_g1_i1:34-525(-)
MNESKETSQTLVEARKTDGMLGVFAKSRIPTGTCLLAIPTTKLLPKADRYSIQVTAAGHTPTDSMQWAMYLNHNCDPNVALKYPTGKTPSEFYIVSSRDIKADEQLTFNYLTTEYDMVESFQCRCGASKCLGKISGFKNLTSEQQQAMKPYISPYLVSMLSYK